MRGLLVYGYFFSWVTPRYRLEESPFGPHSLTILLCETFADYRILYGSSDGQNYPGTFIKKGSSVPKNPSWFSQYR
jgi:hypothetical protein